MRVLASAAFYGMPEGMVTSHMTRDVISVGPDADLFRIVFMFHSNEVRRIPVVEDGKVVGLITRRDTLRALESLYQVRPKHGREPEEIAHARSAV
jgi:CBS domain-containing protein